MKSVPRPWIVRIGVCALLTVAMWFTLGKPKSSEPLGCVSFPSLTSALSNADVDPEIERSDNNIRLPRRANAQRAASATWPVDTDTSLFLATQADLGKAGIIVAGSPEEGRYIVVRSVPIFGVIGVVSVDGSSEKTIQTLPGLVESDEGVFGIKRTGSMLEAYAGCQIVGEIPLNQNDTLASSPRFGVEIRPGGTIDKISPR